MLEHYRSLYQKITPSEQLIQQTKEKMYSSCKEKKRIHPAILKLCSAACIILILRGSIFALADNLNGGDFFKQLFSSRIDPNSTASSNSADPEQLDHMSSETIGTVVDTEELTVDVMGILVSGNAAKIVLRVTANQLDSVIDEDGSAHRTNYEFEDPCRGNLFDDFEALSYRYYYSYEMPDLKDNQLEIEYTLVKKYNLEGKQFEITLDRFGTRNDVQGALTFLKPLYYDTWTFPVSMPSTGSTYKTICFNRPLGIMNYGITLKDINITAFSIMVHLSCSADPEEYYRQIYDYFKDNANLRVNFKNGAVLTERDFDEYTPGGSDIGDLHLTISFAVPVNVNDIKSISLLGEYWDIN